MTRWVRRAVRNSICDERRPGLLRPKQQRAKKDSRPGFRASRGALPARGLGSASSRQTLMAWRVHQGAHLILDCLVPFSSSLFKANFDPLDDSAPERLLPSSRAVLLSLIEPEQVVDDPLLCRRSRQVSRRRKGRTGDQSRRGRGQGGIVLEQGCEIASESRALHGLGKSVSSTLEESGLFELAALNADLMKLPREPRGSISEERSEVGPHLDSTRRTASSV